MKKKYRVQMEAKIIRVVEVEIDIDLLNAPYTHDAEVLQAICDKGREKFDAEIANVKYDQLYMSNVTELQL